MVRRARFYWLTLVLKMAVALILFATLSFCLFHLGVIDNVAPRAVLFGR
jgi:hypothetical protein